MCKFLLIIFFLLICCPSYADEKIPINIIEIYDGDTIKVESKIKNQFDIRLYGIDCYETSKIHRAYHQAYNDKITIEKVLELGNNSKNYLKKLAKNTKNYSFEFMGIDKYGRALGILYFDSTNINELIINSNTRKRYLPRKLD